jgi:molybdenum cofactor biosynthesis enzyme MoaA
MLSRDVYRLIVPLLRKHPLAWRLAKEVQTVPGLIRHTAAQVVPQVIVPQPRKLTVAVTSYCNLRCVGCRYGRDFMPNSELSLAVVRDLLDDAKQVGFDEVRFYGGEPLLHRDLPRMVEHALKHGLHPYVTTNGILLKEKIDDLYEAGLRRLTIGFYGTRTDYDAYVQRHGRFSRLEAGVAYLRNRYGGTIEVYINWLLIRPSCHLAALHGAYQFAEKHDLLMRVDLIHYSLPYFSEGPDQELQFRSEDRQRIEDVVAELIRLKSQNPQRFTDSLAHMRSMPDWLTKGRDMRVPCDAYRMTWVGADGTVKMCYVTFKLGNLYQTRLRDLMFTPAHQEAAKSAYRLDCPNCHCEASTRIQKHLPSRLQYSRTQPFEFRRPGSLGPVETT